MKNFEMTKEEKMEKKEIKINVVEGDTLFSMFDFLCSKINFGKSNFDNDAIACMNILFRELRKDDRIIKQ